MKLNLKLFLAVGTGFAAGFFACLKLNSALSPGAACPSVVTPGPVVAFTQLQRELIVLPPTPRTSFPRGVKDTDLFVPEIELRQSRSLDLIELRDRYPRMDLEETDK